MSKSKQEQSKNVVPWRQAVAAAQDKFSSIIESGGPAPLNFQSEAMFAMQAIEGSTYLQSCDAGSIRNSVINIASVGLSLNPAHKHAYLVPRKDKHRGMLCHLDISYMGLAKLATDSGGVKFICADVVHEKDQFTYNGKDEKPIHSYNPFAARGEPIGAYCYVQTEAGDYLTEVMSADEIEFIRKTYAAPNSPAWIKHWGEQAKKTVIKRAAKMWPKTNTALLQAVQVLNDADGGIKNVTEPDSHDDMTPKRKSETVVEGEFTEEKKDPGPEPEPEQKTEKKTESGMSGYITAAQGKVLTAKMKACNVEENALLAAFELGSLDEMPASSINDALEWVAGEAT